MARRLTAIMPICLLALLMVGAAPRPSARAFRSSPPATYEDLVALFREWRTFQKPKMIGGVADYSAAAMAKQKQEFAGFQKRLAAIDPSGWSRAQQVDYHLVRAEMNGLDFDHRVNRPWARSPSFYIMFYPSRSDQPIREGPHVEGMIEMWNYPIPLSAEHASTLEQRLRTIPKVIEQAKANLVDNARDLWVLGIREMKNQSKDLSGLATKVATSNPKVASAAKDAALATDQFGTWLEKQLPSKTGKSGWGVENYDWYLRNVQLVPFSWSDEVALLTSELARAEAAVKLEEFHDRKLAPFTPITTAEEYRKRHDAAVTEYMGKLKAGDVLTIRDYMEPALRARTHFTPPTAFEFFNQVSDRDPIIMLAHSFHWWDIAQWETMPHASPIRREALLYNIFDTRTEGFASAFEEIMLEAGTFDGHPRVRELVYAIVAERCAVAMGDLKMASNEWTIEEAVKYASSRTPHRWLSETSVNVWGADGEGLYITQPTYGTSYTVGKIQILALMADQARQLGDKFTLKGFIDEFTAAGLLPVSMIRWDMTGLDDEIKRMTKGR